MDKGKRFSKEVRERAVRLVFEAQKEQTLEERVAGEGLIITGVAGSRSFNPAYRTLSGGGDREFGREQRGILR